MFKLDWIGDRVEIQAPFVSQGTEKKRRYSSLKANFPGNYGDNSFRGEGVEWMSRANEEQLHHAQKLFLSGVYAFTWLQTGYWLQLGHCLFVGSRTMEISITVNDMSPRASNMVHFSGSC